MFFVISAFCLQCYYLFQNLCCVLFLLYLSLWQQAGRSGRRERPSLAVYVAFEGPLDQYFMKYHEKLFKSPIECCHIDAQNHKVWNFYFFLVDGYFLEDNLRLLIDAHLS